MRRAHRIEPRGFDENIRRVRRAAGHLTAHHAADPLGPGIVGDDGHFGGQCIFLAVEGEDTLPLLGEAHMDVTRHLASIEDVQRAGAVIGHVVGDIDQSRNWTQADGDQALLHPFGRRSVRDAPDHSPREQRARAASHLIGQRNANGAVERALDLRHPGGLERADAACGKVTRHAPHTQCVGTVRSNRDLDGRIVHAGEVDVALANLGCFGQFDDAVMLVRQFQLPLGRHHAVAFDTPDLANLNGGVEAGNIVAGLGHHDLDPRAGIGCPADDLLLTLVSLDRAHAQAVGVGMLLRRLDIADAEGAEAIGRIVHALNLQPQIGQRIKDFIEGRLGIEVILQPVQGEFHMRLPMSKTKI